jgi:hypothetical protein
MRIIAAPERNLRCVRDGAIVGEGCLTSQLSV